jgi:hypothetical protein
MVDAARRLEAAGADLLLICTNTMHRRRRLPGAWSGRLGRGARRGEFRSQSFRDDRYTDSGRHRSFATLAPGTYRVQGVLDRNGDYNFAGRGPGDFASKAVTVRFPLSSMRVIQLDHGVLWAAHHAVAFTR